MKQSPQRDHQDRSQRRSFLFPCNGRYMTHISVMKREYLCWIPSIPVVLKRSQSRQHSGECCWVCRRDCTTRTETPLSTQRFSIVSKHSSDKLSCLDDKTNFSRGHRKPGNSGRSLFDREPSRHTARLRTKTTIGVTRETP